FVRCLLEVLGSNAFVGGVRKLLSVAGLILRFFNPIHWRRGVRYFFRDHRNLLVVDMALGVVGGTGVSDVFWVPDKYVCQWHEGMVEVGGQEVLYWQALLYRNFITYSRR
ncbi:phosphatidylserine/phosphatidylglycerophosphate/cardiolipin synthase family protein, partial [Pseudomonas syringae pv. tagetis]